MELYYIYDYSDYNVNPDTIYVVQRRIEDDEVEEALSCLSNKEKHMFMETGFTDDVYEDIFIADYLHHNIGKDKDSYGHINNEDIFEAIKKYKLKEKLKNFVDGK